MPHLGGRRHPLWISRASQHPPKLARSVPFLDEETEAEKGEVISSRPHDNKEGEGLGFEPRSVWPRNSTTEATLPSFLGSVLLGAMREVKR